MTKPTWPLALALAVVASGCSASPDAVGDGSYRLYASSENGSLVEATLEVNGDSIVVSTADGDQPAGLGEEGEQIVLCPPSEERKPLLLDVPLTIGSQVFSRPAMFGDCGEVAPERITVIDLDTLDDNSLPPYAIWAEFCDVTDPDC